MAQNLIPCNSQTLRRLSQSITRVDTIARRIPPTYRAGIPDRQQYIKVLLVNAKDYVYSNAGVTPPRARLTTFDHSAGTLSRLNQARTNLRKIFNLIAPSKQKEANGAFASVMQVLKDLEAHVKTCIKAGY